ncbi:MAG TPA: amidohydrolase family protein [Ktedonobacteraceae bacterium]|nr:amidohydrolase family protein [Ktedonobacteraceae bacterium]
MPRIIDCDVHPYVKGGLQTLYQYMPTAWKARFEGQSLAGGNSRNRRSDTERPANRYENPSPGIVRGVFRPDATPPSGESPGTDPAFVIDDLLNRYQLDAAILIPIQSVNAWTDPLLANVFVSAMNDYFIEEWLPLDSRFKLAIGVFPQDPEKSANEIRRHANTKGSVGVYLPLLNILMGNHYYYPIYEAAQECGLPIIIHPTGAEGTYLGAPVLAGGLPGTYFERHVGLTQIAQANLNSLICEGVFERFPALKVVIEEFGFTWAVPLMWRMDMDWKRVRLEAPWVKKLPSQYVFEHVRFTTQPIEEPDNLNDLLAIMQMMHAQETLLFSSDYPHWDADNPTRILTSFNAELKDRIYYQNAVETFGARL